MDWDTWAAYYRRLCAAKEHAISGEQSAAYFEVLKDFPDSCVQQAIYRASREVSGWPKSDKLVELSRDERRKSEALASICDVCHGDGWIDAPDQTHFNRVYSNYVTRCPQCYPKARTAGAA